MDRLKLLRFCFLLFLLAVPSAVTYLHAQITESQARELLAQRNIPEDTLRARLLKKGYDVENLRPSQVQDFQKILLETVNEIEAERALRAAPETPIVVPQDVTLTNEVKKEPLAVVSALPSEIPEIKL